MSRFYRWLTELQPEMFVEISPELAAEKRHRARRLGRRLDGARRDRDPRAGDRRIRPLTVDGRTSIRSACRGTSATRARRGAVANDLTAIVVDPNVSIHEAKAFTCNLRAGRWRTFITTIRSTPSRGRRVIPRRTRRRPRSRRASSI